MAWITITITRLVRRIPSSDQAECLLPSPATRATVPPFLRLLGSEPRLTVNRQDFPGNSTYGSLLVMSVEADLPTMVGDHTSPHFVTCRSGPCPAIFHSCTWKYSSRQTAQSLPEVRMKPIATRLPLEGWHPFAAQTARVLFLRSQDGRLPSGWRQR